MENTNIRDVIIIGSGPAGLTAAIYAARAEMKPLVIAGLSYGGQLMLTTVIENYPGFIDGIEGPILMDNMLKQAQKFGAEVVFDNVSKVEFSTDVTQEGAAHKVFVGNKEYLSKSVIIATGAKPRKLGLQGETEFWGKGVSSCATCDGAFYRGKVVAVVGGGDSAMEEANFLTRFATKVYVIHRRDEFRASKIMITKAQENEKVEFVFDTVVTEIKGEKTVNALSVENLKTGEKKDLAVDGMFLAIGYIPETELFGQYVDLNPSGYAKPSGEYHTMAKTKGIFIAGDIEDDRYRQAITAAADGCKAALDAERWMTEHLV